jgi:hypothetical protein
MLFYELESMLNRLVKRPLKNQITVDFDRQKKSFRLSAIIYRASTKIPSNLKNYIKAREGMAFRPYKTSYEIENTNVRLVQELPFLWGFQPTLRGHTIEFWRLAKRCHLMLSEIAAE